MKDTYKPVIRAKETPIPKMTIGRTDALVNNPGITYNEPGYTYNQNGIAYGGLFGNDFVPIVAHVKVQSPKILFAGDFSGTAPIKRVLGRGMLVGMLGLTYPTNGTIFL